MGDKLGRKDISYYFTEGRHHNFQMILMCQVAQTTNTARMSADTTCITTYNGVYQFDNFKDIYINVIIISTK